jgi:hypothetical protein
VNRRRGGTKGGVGVGVIALLALGAVLGGCGGSGASATVATTAATTAAPPALTLSATCERWANASAAQQRTLAAKRAQIRGISTSAYIEQLANACTPARKSLTLAEAIAADNQPPPDQFAATRINGTSAAYVARSVRKSWNKCGANDVCIPGTYAYAVGCHQPDPQVRVLSCFVTTDKSKSSTGDYGYTVKATVNADTSFSWGIDHS